MKNNKKSEVTDEDILSILNKLTKSHPELCIKKLSLKVSEICNCNVTQKKIRKLISYNKNNKKKQSLFDKKKQGSDLKTSVDSFAKHLSNALNVIVLNGAGVSVNAGIPDFRTPGTGLYDNVKKYGLETPEDIFTIDFFKENPRPFYLLSKEMVPVDKEFKPTRAHRFVKLLSDKKKLLRCYTQNIDGLELKAGVPEEKVIECHGNYRSAKCIKCKKKHDIDKFMEVAHKKTKDFEPMKCGIDGCKGLVKPDIVFFGEDLSKKFYSSVKKDFKKCDLLIVMGSSLEVSPVCDLLGKVGKYVPRLLINMEKVGPFKNVKSKNNIRDVAMLGDCDKSVKELCEKINWSLQ